MHPWKHFKTITKHRWLVRKHCFHVGLYWRGLTHDLSKYSWTEFWAGAKYYQGTRSPNTEEREENGYSLAWMHHKGRNRHHYEYWTDLSYATGKYESVEMPRKYFVEMIMDRRAACIVYRGKNYRDDSALDYFEASREKALMHPETRRQLHYVLTMLAQEGEEVTFRYLKESVLAGCPWPWETEEPLSGTAQESGT